MYKTFAFGKTSNDANFERMTIERNLEGDEDVTFDLKYCGVCHSDVHIADNDLGMTHYPCVPGHELAGVVIRVGGAVTKAVLKRIIGTINPNSVTLIKPILNFDCSLQHLTQVKVGDRVGVGCLVDSCRECAMCRGGDENFCEKSK